MPTQSTVRIGITAALVVLTTVVVLMATGVFDAFDLILAGRAGPSAEVIREDFGDRFEIRGEGYDGQQTYAIARDFPDLEAAESALDTPRYRLMRIVEPALAAPAPHGTPLVLALLLWGLVGLGVLCGAVADLAGRHGRSPSVGYLAAVPAIAPALTLTVEPLAFGLAFAGIALADRRRMGAASACMVAAALTRETALVVALGAGFGLLLRGRWRDAALLTLPAAASVGGWYLYLGTVVDPAWPDMTMFLGLRHVPQSRVALAAAVIALSLAGAWWWRRVPLAWPVALAFGMWVLLDKPDIVEWLALPRVSIPGIVLGLAGPPRSGGPPAVT